MSLPVVFASTRLKGSGSSGTLRATSWQGSSVEKVRRLSDEDQEEVDPELHRDGLDVRPEEAKHSWLCRLKSTVKGPPGLKAERIKRDLTTVVRQGRGRVRTNEGFLRSLSRSSNLTVAAFPHTSLNNVDPTEAPLLSHSVPHPFGGVVRQLRLPPFPIKDGNASSKNSTCA